MNKKLIFGLLLLFVTIVSVSTASAFWPFDSGDLVDVTDVIFETGYDYGDTPFGYAIGQDPVSNGYISAIAFKIIPKETISGVNSFRVDNLKVTYENGQTEDFGTITFSNKNAYLADTQYTFSHKFYLDEDINGQKVHINGDIVVDTLNEKNKVIGHLDYDTTVETWSATYS